MVPRPISPRISYFPIRSKFMGRGLGQGTLGRGKGSLVARDEREEYHGAILSLRVPRPYVMPAMNASDSPVALPTLLGQIYLGARTGRLRLHREEGAIGLSFHRGRFVLAEALEADDAPMPLPDPEDELARHLARVLFELSIERRSTGNGGPRPLSREPLLAALEGVPGEASFSEESIEDGQDGVLTTEQLVLEVVRRLPGGAPAAARSSAT